MSMSYAGMKVVVVPDAVAEGTERLFPASRHRSARIRKKLLRRFGGEFRKVPAAYRVGATLYVHPAIWAQMRASLLPA